MEGLPNLASAGNVVYKELAVRCSLRLAPTMKKEVAVEIIKKLVNNKVHNNIDYTYGATVELVFVDVGLGFDAPKLPDGLTSKLNAASKKVFGCDPLHIGMGGSIPFMEVFSELFPETNFILTGVGFPSSNAHAANESIDLEYTRKLTTVIAEMISLM
jgi:acetylornithine deacetylase/succinyl-diaminopimelate desuccinylase-like protein